MIHERRTEPRVGSQTLDHEIKDRDEAFDRVEDRVQEYVVIDTLAFEELLLICPVANGQSGEEVQNEAHKADDRISNYWANEF